MVRINKNKCLIEGLYKGFKRGVDVDFGMALPALNLPFVNLNYHTFDWFSRIEMYKECYTATARPRV